jgi:hypothetical protein
MATSTIVEKLIGFIVKVFWPWFVQHVWPIIQSFVLQIITNSITALGNKIKDFVDSRSHRREEYAKRRAEDADSAASVAIDAAEKDKQEAIASVWREVAEQFRSENDILRSQITELLSRSEQTLEDDIRSMKPKLTNLENDPSLSIGGNSLPLPQIAFKQIDSSIS